MNRFLKQLLLFALPLLGVAGVVFGMLFLYESPAPLLKVNADTQTIFMGDSHIRSAVADSLMSHTENLAQSSESFYFTARKLERVLEENPQVKTVVLGAGYHSLSDYYNDFITGQYSFATSVKYFFILPVTERLYFLRLNSNAFFAYLRALIKEGYAQMRRGESELRGNYFNKFSRSCAEDKYVEQRLKLQYFNESGLKGFSVIDEVALGQIVAGCSQHNVKLYLLNTPIHHSYNTRIPPAFVKQYNLQTERYAVEVLDLHQWPLPDSCFAPDGDHLSQAGAVLFTDHLRQLLK